MGFIFLVIYILDNSKQLMKKDKPHILFILL
jgi:hypothetical protein